MSQGEIIEKLKENINEAIEGYLEVLREEGRKLESDVEILEVGCVRKSYTGKEISRLKKKGWTLRRIKGSHHIYAKAFTNRSSLLRAEIRS